MSFYTMNINKFKIEYVFKILNIGLYTLELGNTTYKQKIEPEATVKCVRINLVKRVMVMEREKQTHVGTLGFIVT